MQKGQKMSAEQLAANRKRMKRLNEEGIVNTSEMCVAVGKRMMEWNQKRVPKTLKQIATSRKNMTKLHQDPEYLMIVGEAQEKYWTPEKRKEQGEIMAERDKDLEFRAKNKVAVREGLRRYFTPEKREEYRRRAVRLNQEGKLNTLERKIKSIERITRLNQDSEFQAKRDKASSENMKRQLQDPEFQAKCHTPASQAKRSENMRKLRRDPEFNAKVNTPEQRAIVSKRTRERWRDPEEARRMLNRHRQIPSGLERRMIAILERFHLPFKFVGNGALIIGTVGKKGEYKIPDFQATNGEKIVLETYAKEEKELRGNIISLWQAERNAIYYKNGWECIYFEASEVNEETIFRRLKGVLHAQLREEREAIELAQSVSGEVDIYA